MAITVTYYIFYCLEMLFSVIAFLLHIIGIIAIHKNPTKNNQNLILCSLSMAEIISLSFSIVAMICERMDTPSFKVIEILVTIFLYVSNYELVMVMLLLTADRLVCVLDPLKYPTRMTRKRLMTALAVSWGISFTIGITRGVTPSHYLRETITTMIYVFGGSYVMFAIITYSYIMLKIRMSMQTFSSSRYRLRVRKEFLVPGVIILTFLFLYYIPYAVYHFIYKQLDRTHSASEKRSHLVGYAICDLLPSVAYGADAFIYIIFTKRYRNIIINMFKCSRPQASTICRGRTCTQVVCIHNPVPTRCKTV